LKGEKQKMTNKNTERQLIELIATDRIYMPISSMDGKLKRSRVKLAETIQFPEKIYTGERVYARVVDEEGQKARGMKEAISIFSARHPLYGKELAGLIAEQRINNEPTMYFGMKEGCRLTTEDYMGVMRSLGFSENKADAMYGELMDASRRLSRARKDAERSILVGKLGSSSD
jgi:hypothetical protein